MRHFLKILFFIILAHAAAHTYASTEGIAIWSTFTIESAGIDSSGPIKITGVQSIDGIDSLSINAFDRRTMLSLAQVAQLRGFSANGMSLSYERGYDSIGGRTIYITLIKRFTGGTEETKIIECKEQGGITIGRTEKSKKIPKDHEYKSRMN